MGRLSNNAEIIADLSALRLVTQEIIGLLLLAGGGKRNYLNKLRDGAHDRLVRDEIVVPGFKDQDVKARAALTIDQLFDGIGFIDGAEVVEQHPAEIDDLDQAPSQGSIIIEMVEGQGVAHKRAKWTFRSTT